MADTAGLLQNLSPYKWHFRTTPPGVLASHRPELSSAAGKCEPKKRRVILDQRGVRALNCKDHNLNCHRLNCGIPIDRPLRLISCGPESTGYLKAFEITPRAQHSTATTCRCASRVEGRSDPQGSLKKANALSN